jgi:hypothetical protein
MRKLSRPAIMITLGVVVLAVILSVMVGMLMKNTSKKTRISQLGVNQSGGPSKNGRERGGQEEESRIVDETKKTESTIGDAIRKEQQMLKESDKGGYVGGVGVGKKKKESDLVLDDIVVEEPDGDDSLDPSVSRKGGGRKSIYNDAVGRGKGGKAAGEGDDGELKRKAWEYLYFQKSSGGFVNKPQPVAKDQDSEKPGSPGAAGGPKVSYYKPYRAVVDRTFTSAQANATFVATGAEPPVKGWKVVGRAVANFTDNRFHVEVSGVIGPDNAHHQMKGYVASIDETDGIVSAVKHEDVAGTVASGVMAGVSSFLNALRKDTTTVEVGAGGVTVTGQTKSDDRLREGGLAAGDTIFQGLSKKVEGSTKKSPTLIMEKGVPVLIYFTP